MRKNSIAPIIMICGSMVIALTACGVHISAPGDQQLPGTSVQKSHLAAAQGPEKDKADTTVGAMTDGNQPSNDTHVSPKPPETNPSPASKVSTNTATISGPPAPNSGDSPWPEGIINTINQVGTDWIMKNVWQHTDHGAHVQVYAGAMKDDPSQGVVVVMGDATQHAYPTPTKHGSVKVTHADQLRLTLTAVDGVTFVFDVPSHSYIAVQ